MPSTTASLGAEASGLPSDRREHLLVVPAPCLQQPAQVLLRRDVAREGAEDLGRGERSHVVRAHRQVGRHGHLRGGNPEIGGGAAQVVRNALVHTPFLHSSDIARVEHARVHLEVLRQTCGHRGQSGRHCPFCARPCPQTGYSPTAHSSLDRSVVGPSGGVRPLLAAPVPPPTAGIASCAAAAPPFATPEQDTCRRSIACRAGRKIYGLAGPPHYRRSVGRNGGRRPDGLRESPARRL